MAVAGPYPWAGMFNTRQEVEDYFGRDAVVCLLCGRSFRALGRHLYRHSISIREYKELYGLPLDRGLTSAACYQAKSQSVSEEVRLHLSRLSAVGSAVAAETNRGKPLGRAPFLREESIDKMVAGRGTRRWNSEDFDRVLAEIPRKNRLQDIWSNPDLPKRSLWNRYRRKNPQYDRLNK
jgi:ROS/MUCR transcriptional regulator protein